jgi:hypothetical protein
LCTLNICTKLGSLYLKTNKNYKDPYFFFFFFYSPILTNISLLLISNLSDLTNLFIKCMHEVCVNCRRNFVDSHQIQCTNWYKNPNQIMNLPRKSQGIYKSTFIINSFVFLFFKFPPLTFDYIYVHITKYVPFPTTQLANRAKRGKGQHH